MNNVDKVFNDIINADLSIDDYVKLSEMLALQVKEILYAKFLLETSVSQNAMRIANLP